MEATPSTQVWPEDAASWGFSGTNLTLQSGELYPQPRITVTGIPYGLYDVYLYAAAGGNGGQGIAAISVANGVSGGVDPTGTYYYNFNWQNGHYQ